MRRRLGKPAHDREDHLHVIPADAGPLPNEIDHQDVVDDLPESQVMRTLRRLDNPADVRQQVSLGLLRDPVRQLERRLEPLDVRGERAPARDPVADLVDVPAPLHVGCAAAQTR